VGDIARACHPDAVSSAGQAYLVHPTGGAGVAPGVLVLHSWWGMTQQVKQRCHALADAGYVAMAPDLMGGVVPLTAAEGELELSQSDPNVNAALVLASIVTLRTQTIDPEAPVSIIGYSMGGSWGLWAAAREALSVRAVVSYYGTQSIGFDDLVAPVLGHFGERDHLVSIDDVVEMQAHLKLSGTDATIEWYPEAGHFFAEPEAGELHDSTADALAWQRTMDFLADVHR